MKIRTAAAICAISILACMSVQAQEAESASAGEELIQIGEASGGADYQVTLKNATGEEITGIALRVNYDEFSENMLPADETLEDGEAASFICAQAEMVNYVPPVYDLQLTFADGKELTVHTLPFGDADEISLMLGTAEAAEGETSDETEPETSETQFAYISFTSLSLQYETDTKRREGEIAQIGEAVLKADFEAKTAGGGASGAAGGGDAGAGAGAAPAPAPEQCLDNGLTF